MPFAGGVSPPLPVVSLLFSVSYPQDRRSYYLFFNYLFFLLVWVCGNVGGGSAVWTYSRLLWVCGLDVEKWTKSHKPVEINDLRLLVIQETRGYLESNPAQ